MCACFNRSKGGIRQEKFHEELIKVVQGIPKYDIKLIVDLNAKIGRDVIYEHITGGHSKHEESNENGIKLIKFATEMNMKIMSTRFQRKDILYKGTWTAPDSNTCNQIDLVLIEEKHIKAIKNIRTQKRADSESDHFIVTKQEINSQNEKESQ